MNDKTVLEYGGEILHLTGERAVWLPQRKALLVADVHLGKGAVFRHEGIAIPAGSSDRDLQRLTQLVKQYQAQEVYVLGDLVHGAITAALGNNIQHWLASLSTVRIVLVNGNHDRHLGGIPDDWRLECVDQARLGELLLVHELPAQSRQPSIAGHIHPFLSLRDGRRDRLRLPVFWLRQSGLILPAFGSFTGGFAIRPEASDRLFVIHEQGVSEFRGELFG